MTEEQRIYNMSDAELCMLVSNMVSFMTRDNVEFTARGVTTVMRTAYETLGNAFEVFPSDDEYRGLIMIETDAKNILYNTVMNRIQLISGFFEQKWGKSSGQYTELGIKGIHNVSDGIFLGKARKIIHVAENYLADLTPIGLTQVMIDALETDAQSMENKMNDMSDAIALRAAKARERTTKGNQLYSYAVQYSTVGKLIWENTDSAKYNDYVIYPASHPGLPKPQNVTAVYNPAIDEDIILSWDTVPGATFYEVFYSVVALGAPSGNYNLLNTFTTSPQQIPPVLNKRNYFKIKAKNDSQTSDYSDEAWVDIT